MSGREFYLVAVAVTFLVFIAVAVADSRIAKVVSCSCRAPNLELIELQFVTGSRKFEIRNHASNFVWSVEQTA
jgi:hypothetical protein